MIPCQKKVEKSYIEKTEARATPEVVRHKTQFHFLIEHKREVVSEVRCRNRIFQSYQKKKTQQKQPRKAVMAATGCHGHVLPNTSLSLTTIHTQLKLNKQTNTH